MSTGPTPRTPRTPGKPETPGTPETPAVRPARNRAPLAGLLVGHAISLTGNVVTLIAVPLYVLSQTHSAARTGLAGVVAALPVVFGGALGGVVVDRVGHRRASVLADLGGGSTMAVVPVLGHLVRLPYGGLLALVFCAGLLDTPAQTARSALLPEAAQAARVPIERAVGWFGAVERSSKLLGAPLAGLLVALVGPLNVFALDAASFLLSAAVVFRFVLRRAGAGSSPIRPPSAGTGAAHGGLRRYGGDLAEGLRFLAGDRLLRAVVVLVVITNAFDSGNSSVLLPVYAQRELGGAVAFGLVVGAAGAGALAGSLAFGAIGHRLPRRWTFIVAFLLAGGPPYFAFALGLPLPALLAVKVLAGISSGALNPILGIIELERVPVELRARVFGLLQAGSWAAMPVGALAAGFAVDHVGLTPTFAAVGVAYVVVTLMPLRGGPWRGLERPAAGPPRPAPADDEGAEPELSLTS